MKKLAAILFALFFVPLIEITAHAQVTKIRLGTTAATSTEKVAFALAKEAGVLKKHNLELEVILINGGSIAMQALLARSLDIITTSATVFLHGFIEGADVKIIGGVNNRFPYTFFARPNISEPSQLKGKVVGITRYGSTDELATRMALDQFGLNPKSDVKIIQGGGSAARINALLAGSIDATSLISGVSHVAKKAGLMPLVDFAAKELDYQMTGVVSRGDYLKNNSDAVKRFMRAYIEAIHYYKANRAEAIKETMKAIRTDERQLAEADYNFRARAFPDDGRPTLKGIQLAIDELVKETPKAKNVTPQQVIDLGYLP
ncbi:MAG TPA: ABC transporter substrate-binding protein [Acidobacteriota bacterium]|nr:ABC transporter substrate-binding protein [Acidobacteriota bacterium]